MVGSARAYLRKDQRLGNYHANQRENQIQEAGENLIKEDRAAIETTDDCHITYRNWCKRVASEQFMPFCLSFRSYQYKLEKYLYPAIGEVPLQMLDRFMLVNLMMDWKQKEVDAYTIEELKSLLSKTLDYAVQLDILSENPYEQIVKKRTRVRIEALSLSEQADLDQFIERKNSLPGQAAIIALYMGLRAEEIAALKWEDIDCEQNLLYVKAGAAEDRRSTGAQRIIPIPDKIVPLFLRLKESAETSHYVFSQFNQSRQPQWLTEYFHGSGEKVKLAPIHFRRLRYTFAKCLLEETGDLTAVSALMGEPETPIKADNDLREVIQQPVVIQTVDQPIRA
ncbi:tyrosine-type recombinase/integrase [Candidatus Enterococcus ferrettii]|uniref:Tyr recombinase domain-containing protein n=1 Tax=Candidatus Enterococcus ferrettii TaxID=2815324 RepID=A0ABV0EXE5_9ENTE|nr:site-specific integrase [Enterococcus sp. 665A]MBO1339436.1 site-specific integrase [Enterococcus sp. 665A]